MLHDSLYIHGRLKEWKWRFPPWFDLIYKNDVPCFTMLLSWNSHVRFCAKFGYRWDYFVTWFLTDEQLLLHGWSPLLQSPFWTALQRVWGLPQELSNRYSSNFCCLHLEIFLLFKASPLSLFFCWVTPLVFVQAQRQTSKVSRIGLRTKSPPCSLEPKTSALPATKLSILWKRCVFWTLMPNIPMAPSSSSLQKTKGGNEGMREHYRAK